MRVTLMHNPEAGDEEHSPERLTSMLADAGHDVLYQSLKEDDWQATFLRPTDLVLVAGGDGTVCEVFKELAGSAIPVTLLPFGSANNVARTLGFSEADVFELPDPAKMPRLHYDLGQVESGWGGALFVESMGGGIFGEVLRRAERSSGDEPDGDEKIQLGLRLTRDVIADSSPAYWKLELDGHDLSGQLLALEAMNVRELGPNLSLAPEADPCDGMLDVVLIRPEHRAALTTYVEARIEGSVGEPPALEVRRGRRVEMQMPAGCPLHVDDELWPADAASRSVGSVVARISGLGLELLLSRPG
jgi:diacylglycerol kinase (ATP)